MLSTCLQHKIKATLGWRILTVTSMQSCFFFTSEHIFDTVLHFPVLCFLVVDYHQRVSDSNVSFCRRWLNDKPCKRAGDSCMNRDCDTRESVISHVLMKAAHLLHVRWPSSVWFSLTKTKTKMPKQQNLSLNESASIQYGTYGYYGRTALNPWLTVDGI